MKNHAWSCLQSVNAWSAGRSKYTGADSWGKCLYQTSFLPAQLIAEYPDESPGKQLGSTGSTQNEHNLRYVSVCQQRSSKFKACVCISLQSDSNLFGACWSELSQDDSKLDLAGAVLPRYAHLSSIDIYGTTCGVWDMMPQTPWYSFPTELQNFMQESRERERERNCSVGCPIFIEYIPVEVLMLSSGDRRK